MNEEMNAQGLLRSAARLIERALIKFDMTKTTCRECGEDHYVNVEHARLYQQFSDTPSKLERAAAVLDGDPEALEGRRERAQLDKKLKQSKR